MYIKHKDYCKCAERKDGSKCEFCVLMKKVRSYKNREKSGFFSETSQNNFNELKRKFEEYTGLAFSEHGRENTKEKTAKDQPPVRIAPDTFSYKNNKLFIKDQKDVVVLVIDLENKTIYSTLKNAKYLLKGADNPDISTPLEDIFNNIQILNKIKDIIRK